MSKTCPLGTRVVKPRTQRTVVTVIKVGHGLSERKPYQLVRLNRSIYSYRTSDRQYDPLRSRLKELATRPHVWLLIADL